jgi:hypothetical protein
LVPSDGVFGRFDLVALCGCPTLNVCLFDWIRAQGEGKSHDRWRKPDLGGGQQSHWQTAVSYSILKPVKRVVWHLAGERQTLAQGDVDPSDGLGQRGSDGLSK